MATTKRSKKKNPSTALIVGGVVVLTLVGLTVWSFSAAKKKVKKALDDVPRGAPPLSTSPGAPGRTPVKPKPARAKTPPPVPVESVIGLGSLKTVLGDAILGSKYHGLADYVPELEQFGSASDEVLTGTVNGKSFRWMTGRFNVKGSTSEYVGVVAVTDASQKGPAYVVYLSNKLLAGTPTANAKSLEYLAKSVAANNAWES